MGKISASKLIFCFSIHPVAYGHQAFSPLDNVTLNTANKKTDQSLSDFQTGIGAEASVTLDTEQLIFHIRDYTFDTITSPHGSDRLF